MPIERDWLTTAEVAQELELSQGAVTEAIATGRMKAEKISPGLLGITQEELQRYKAEHLGKHGWEKRKAADYVPDTKAAERARRYRERKKAQQQERLE